MPAWRSCGTETVEFFLVVGNGGVLEFEAHVVESRNMVVWAFYGVLRLESCHLFGLCVFNLPFFAEDCWNFGGLARSKGWTRLIILFALLNGIPELRPFLNKRLLALSLFFIGPIDSQNLAQLILILGLRQETIQIVTQCIDIQKFRIPHASSLRIDRRNIAKVIALAIFLKLVLLRRTKHFMSLYWLVFLNRSANVSRFA